MLEKHSRGSGKEGTGAPASSAQMEAWHRTVRKGAGRERGRPGLQDGTGAAASHRAASPAEVSTVRTKTSTPDW